ncbi:MAG: AMP-dependent synthetase [Hydrocarboniphaga sp.]|uniref:long-chain-fatty-acid--CoA ligase n=1 Tax=Hydrocarboniphaga sp. TaxID=2033016 RepID=UPI00262B03B3|nr:long-chain-fatty-acid--CoA ligase [Hydrocarboniphaga sp.]MDB5968737.1 AMP-dependent synthetase [Hydrocarboniphaga sp.]
MKTCGEIILRHGRRSPDRVAVVFEGRRTTYGELLSRSKRLSQSLRQRGVGAQDRVAVLAMNCNEWFELGFVCHLNAFVMATVNFRLAPPEIAYILKDSAPKVLIFEQQYAETVAALREQLPSIEHYICIGKAPDWALDYEGLLEGLPASGREDEPPVEPQSSDLALLIYTSGTTGRPKGVMKTQAATLASFKVNAYNLGLRPDSRILIIMPMFHVGAMSEANAMMYAGGTVVLQRKFEPIEVLRTIESERITHVHMAPTMVQALLDEPSIQSHDTSSLRIFNYAAAPMPVSLLKQAIDRFGPIFMDIYGSTEAPGTILFPHQHVLDGDPEQVKRLGSVGQSNAITDLRIVDDGGKPCAPGIAGEILVRSEAAMAGYWNDSVATQQAVRNGWFHTGDIGYLDDQDYLFLVDRKKDMIISGGENIYCREVEEALMEHGGLQDVAVIGIPDSYWGEVVHAVAVAKAGVSVTEADLIAFVGTRIARYKRPKSVEFVAELPRLPSGKVMKHVLRDRYKSK